MYQIIKKIFITITLLFISALLIHYFIFYNRLHFYKPVSVVINNNLIYSSDSITITGITPFGKEYIFPFNTSEKCWKLGYVFLKSIHICLDTALLNDSFNLTIISKNNVFSYNKDLFLKKWLSAHDNDRVQTFCMPDEVVDKKFFASFFSVFRWGLTQKLLAIAIMLILVIYVRIKLNFIDSKNQLVKNKRLIAFLGFYAIIAFLIIKEFVRYNTHHIEGIGTLNALIFLLFVFLATHIVFELIFIFLRIKLDLKQKIRLLIFSVFFIISIIEFALRELNVYATYSEVMFGKYSSSNYTPPANYYMINKNDSLTIIKKNEFIFKRFINTEGLSDIEHKIEKDSGIFRIIGLGDSFTEGVGADFDSTWLSFLSRNLNHQYPFQKFELFNAGISGCDPFFGYLLLKDKLLKYQPNLVLLTINTTDVSDYLFRGGFERFQKDGSVKFIKPPEWKFIYAYSFVSRLIIHDLLGYDYNFLKGNEQSARTNEAIEALHDISHKFYKLSNSNNFKLVLVLHPQLIEAKQGKYLYDSFASVFKSDTILNVVDILSFFNNNKINTQETAIQYYWPIDKHHNAKGYKLFADGVFEYLSKKGINEINEINEIKKNK